MPYEDPSRNRCCCGVHVTTGANMIGGIGVVCQLLIVMFTDRWFLAVCALLFCVAYGTILYAYKTRNARFYWPFLLTNGFAIAVGLAYILFLLAMFLVNPDFWQRFMNGNKDYQFQETIHLYPRQVTAYIAFVMLVAQVLNIWFELVVYNAYSYMKREQLNGAVV